MNKMNSIWWYDELSTDNVEKFENGLIRWVKENASNNAIMVFDMESLYPISKKLISEHATKEIPYGHIHEINSPLSVFSMKSLNITIEFYRLDISQRCILKTVKTNTRHIYHNPPSSWKDSRLWYGF